MPDHHDQQEGAAAGLPPPSIQINDDPPLKQESLDPVNDLSAVSAWINPQLPKLADGPRNGNMRGIHVERRLQNHAVRNPFDSGDNQYFWPSRLFEHLFDREAISGVIRELVERQVLSTINNGRPQNYSSEEWSCKVWSDRINGTNEASKAYRSVLAILVLVGKADCIESFMNASLGDSDLPLRPDLTDKYYSERADQPQLPFGEWRLEAIKSFHNHQYRFFVHVLAKAVTPGEVLHYDFDATHVLPWVSIPNGTSVAPPDGSLRILGGGFGEVKQIVIHAWQHMFHESLDYVSAVPSCFALKRLYTPNKEEFDLEVKHLKRFGGLHPHIVTLLATFARRTTGEIEYLLLFPWAECDLLEYWRRKANLERNHELYKWIAKQLCGITSALSFIHDPEQLDSDGSRLYGRHGDIKPENVLWFKSSDQGNLVLSDLGLTRTHRQGSRSNRPGADIPVSPNYRPPECDMEGEGGRISRSFDIWTLGCLFLEFMVWTVDGYEECVNFKKRRMSPYIHGHDTPIYFEIVRVDDARYAFDIKASVTKEFQRLREHKNCSRYVQDMLDLIQRHMLTVQAGTPLQTRIAAPELLQKLEAMEEACKNSAYCIVPCQPTRPMADHLPVVAPLNRVTVRHIADIDSESRSNIIKNYKGPTRFR